MTCKLWVALLFCFGFFTSLLALAEPKDAAGQILDFSKHEVSRILQHGPWPPPAARDAGNRLSGNPQAIALGQQLFFDQRLSIDGSMSCASCHIPAKAFGDGLPRSMGREKLDRNAPSLWNNVHERWYGWDGASDSLWSQAIRPLTDKREMAANAQHISKVIASDAQLSCRWNAVFGSPPGPHAEGTLVNAAKAIAAFNASLVSGPTAFDAFRDALERGERTNRTEFPLSAQRGLRLFVGQGQCTVCHVGPLFSNGEFGDIGIPFFVRPGAVDSGRHGGILSLKANRFNLLSGWSDGPNDVAVKTRHVDLQHRNFGEFKVPSLRNVAETAPFMHNGQFASLNAVVRHYSEINLERLHADGEQILKPLALTDSDVKDMVAFLSSLSDPQATSWTPKKPAPCSSRNEAAGATRLLLN